MRFIWPKQWQLSGKKQSNNEVVRNLLEKGREKGQEQALAARLSGVPAIS